MNKQRLLDGRAAVAAVGIARVAMIAASAAALGWLATPVLAFPGGEQVIRGNVTFERDGNRTIIRASDGSIINYLNFNIGRDEIVRFIQPGELARVLNRITGGEPTMIEGRLLANGQVYLVNPAGVMFGNGAVVNVGGLYAAAGNLTDSRFVNGVNKFSDLSGPVVNDGSINGGNINLVGQTVANNGSINSNHGIITMVAGNEVLIRQHGEKITVKVDGVRLTDQDRPQHGETTPDMTATPGVENTGSINATRGKVMLGAGDMYALAVRNSGTIRAAKGDITVAAKDGLIQNTSTGVISADADRGQAGSVTVQGPSVLNQGAISADANTGQAGSVEVTSQDHTYLTDGSVISAAGDSGNAAGGDVLVHSYHGLTVLAGGAKVDVSGGATGGDGGFAEVSGNLLTFNGYADLKAKSGYQRGSLLLDPNNIIINDTGGNDGFLNGNIISFNEPNTAQNVFISDEALEALVGSITLQATGDITVTHQVDLIHNNDLTLQAYKNIFINEPINGAHSLNASSDVDGNGFGDVFISAPLVLSGNATFNGPHTFLNGFSLRTAGTQDYLGPADLCVDMTLRGSNVRFHSTLDDTNAGEQSLTINGPNVTDGSARFDGPVGACLKLEFLQVNGSTAVNGGVVTTKDFQHYFGPTTIGANTTLTSTDAGDIHFGDSLDGHHNLLVQTAGLTSFDGDSGDLDQIQSITTDAPGATFIAGDMKAGDIDLNDPVSLGANVTLNGSNSVDFAQTLDGNGHSLIINSPLTGFHGDATELNLLRTDAAGQTDIQANITGNKLDFNDPVNLLSDSVLTGHDFIDFHRTVDGAFDLTTNSSHLVRFGGDVGGDQALASLTTNVGSAGLVDENLVVIDGNLIRATGDIRFNPAGRNRPAEVATIAARSRNGLAIESTNGDVFMGPNEKLTSLGDLEISALNGRATIGDLNSLGDMTVRSDDIRIRARKAGSILDSHGDLVDDEGADFIAGGSIFFSSSPHVTGAGADPIFATKSGSGFNSTISGFEFRAISDLHGVDFKFGDTVLDLTAPPSNPPHELATALSDGPTRIRDSVPRDPFALRPLERLGIYMRSLSADELRGTLAGRGFYNDTPDKMDAGPDEHTVLANRLRRGSVLTALEKYSSMFVKEVPGDPDAQSTLQDQAPFIREALAKAWKSYLDSEAAAGNVDPSKFRAFLESQADQQDALAYINGLNGLFREIRTMGATRLELRNSLNGVLGPIKPEGMDQSQLEQALGVESLG